MAWIWLAGAGARLAIFGAKCLRRPLAALARLAARFGRVEGLANAASEDGRRVA